MRQLHKYLRLTWRERAFFGEALVLLLLSYMAVRMVPFRHIYHF